MVPAVSPLAGVVTCHENDVTRGHAHSAASIIASVAQSPMMIASAPRAPLIQLSETRRQVNKQLTNSVDNNNNLAAAFNWDTHSILV